MPLMAMVRRLRHYGGLGEGEKLILQLLFAAEDAALPLRSWAEALKGKSLREAERTYDTQVGVVLVIESIRMFVLCLV